MARLLTLEIRCRTFDQLNVVQVARVSLSPKRTVERKSLTNGHSINAQCAFNQNAGLKEKLHFEVGAHWNRHRQHEICARKVVRTTPR